MKEHFKSLCSLVVSNSLLEGMLQCALNRFPWFQQLVYDILPKQPEMKSYGHQDL